MTEHKPRPVFSFQLLYFEIQEYRNIGILKILNCLRKSTNVLRENCFICVLLEVRRQCKSLKFGIRNSNLFGVRIYVKMNRILT